MRLEICAWLHFRKQDYVAGTADLIQLLSGLLDPKAKPQDQAQAARLLGWAGRLREFAAIAANEQYRPPVGVLEELDAVAEKFPSEDRRLTLPVQACARPARNSTSR